MSRRGSWVVRAEREAAARRKKLMADAKQAERDYLASQKEVIKIADRAQAEHEVEVYENHREYLLSMHKDCGPAWDWRQLAVASPPVAPEPPRAHEAKATADLEAYQPSFFDKAFRIAATKRAELQAKVTSARIQDAAVLAELQNEYAQKLDRHQWETRVAAGILSGDLAAYREALEVADPFAELADASVSVNVVSVLKDIVTLQCVVDRKALPEQEKKLTATGKLTTKSLAQTAKWAMHEQFVASCGLRVAREVLAVLPVARAIVNVSESGIDASTGRCALFTLLAMSLERSVLEGFRFQTIDPVASLKHLPNRTNFRKSTGFEPVEPMTDQESFMTMSRAQT